MAKAPAPRWWSIRRAQNRKPATYRCPLCGGHLPALSEHMLLYPEGRSDGRRHAHSACVMAARKQGRLPTKEEWQRTQPRPQGLWTRAMRRLTGGRAGPGKPGLKEGGQSELERRGR